MLRVLMLRGFTLNVILVNGFVLSVMAPNFLRRLSYCFLDQLNLLLQGHDDRWRVYGATDITEPGFKSPDIDLQQVTKRG
jgi:hypothetical protein